MSKNFSGIGGSAPLEKVGPYAYGTMAFTPQGFLAVTHYFSSKYYQVLTATHLPTLEGWKAELA